MSSLYDDETQAMYDECDERNTPTLHQLVCDAIRRQPADAGHRALVNLLSEEDREKECLRIVADELEYMASAFRSAVPDSDADNATLLAEAAVHYWTTAEDRSACVLANANIVFDVRACVLFGDTDNVARKIEAYTRAAVMELRATGCADDERMVA